MGEVPAPEGPGETERRLGVLERRMAELEELTDELREQLDGVLAWLERGETADADRPRRRRWGVRRIARGIRRRLRGRGRRGEPGWPAEPEVRARVDEGPPVRPLVVGDDGGVLEWSGPVRPDEAVVDVARWVAAAEDVAFVELRPGTGERGWLWRRAAWEAAPDRDGRLAAAVDSADGAVVGATVGRGAGPLDGPAHPRLVRSGRRHVRRGGGPVEQALRRIDVSDGLGIGGSDCGLVVASDDPRDGALIDAVNRELSPGAAIVTPEGAGGARLAERLRGPVDRVWDLGAGLAPELHGDTVSSVAAATGWRWVAVVGDGRLVEGLRSGRWTVVHLPVVPDQVVPGIAATAVAVDDATEAAARAAGFGPLRWRPRAAGTERALHRADELRRRFGIPAGRRVVAAAGPLVPAERPEDVVAVALRLAGEEAVFLLAGAGPLDGSLRDLVRYHGLENVVLAGDASAVDAVAAADLVLCPGEPHPYPEAVALAVAAGVPVVAVDHPAARELTAGLGDEGRALVPMIGDVEALAAAVRRLAGRRLDPPSPRAHTPLRDLLAGTGPGTRS